MTLILVLAVAVAGCGGSGSKPKPSATQAASVSSATTSSAIAPTAPSSPTTSPHTTSSPRPAPPPVAELKVSSEVFHAGKPLGNGERTIPARYTCDGADVSPPISWTGVPARSAQLFLVVFDLASGNPHLYFNWAVAGLKPTLHGIPAGRLPAGAIVGRNSLGQTRYSVCPPKGKAHEFGIYLYALKRPIHVRPGFTAWEANQAARNAMLGEGQSGFAYERG